MSWRVWPGAGRRPRGWRGGLGLSWRRPTGWRTRRSSSGWAPTRIRSASGAGALPNAGSTASTTSPVPGLRARSAMRRSRRSSPAPWKRRRPTARTGACARWPAPQAMRRRRSTASGKPSACSRTAQRPSSCHRTRCLWRRHETSSASISTRRSARSCCASMRRARSRRWIAPVRFSPCGPGRSSGALMTTCATARPHCSRRWTSPPARSSDSASRAGVPQVPAHSRSPGS